MVDYNDNKRTVAKTYKYGIYINPRNTLTQTELEDKGVKGILDADTKVGHISTADWGNLFKALYYCTNNDRHILCYCTRTELVSVTINAINHALEEKYHSKDHQKAKSKTLNRKLDKLLELSTLAYRLAKVLPVKDNADSQKVIDMLNDQMCESICGLLSYAFIAHKVFTKLIELDIIDNYEESWTYDTWDLSEITHC